MRLQPVEIYQVALEAGFSPDQAVTMTAIAMAESGGNPAAHNAVGEDSIGLWQVNRNAHPDFIGLDGTDPLTNARMAYEVSGHGADIGRWTVTHADSGARYLQYRAQAEAAAAAAGYPDAEGQWDPPDNYYSPKVSAGPAADGPDPDPVLAEATDAVDADAAAVATPAAPPEPPSLDSDADGLLDEYERSIGTDPNAVDTDRDGITDSAEVREGSDPLAFGDNPLVGAVDDDGGLAPPLTTDTPPTPTTVPGDPAAAAAATTTAASVAPAVGPDNDIAALGADAAVGPEAQAIEGGPLDTFLDAALSQDGGEYIFGAEVDLADADPVAGGDAFDCSELTEWAAARAGVTIPDGSWTQYLDLQEQGGELTVDEALRTPGALVFNFSSEPTAEGGRPSSAHVAISLGDGRLMEARGREYGVAIAEAEGREFSHAAYIPELGTEPTPELMSLEGTVMAEPLPDALAAAPAAPEALDSDVDGLMDAYERMIGTDPFAVDTDLDGFLDSAEVHYDHDPLDFGDNLLVAPEDDRDLDEVADDLEDLDQDDTSLDDLDADDDIDADDV